MAHSENLKPGSAGNDGDSRIAPDPLAVVLPAVAALGAITSIATVYWVGVQAGGERARARRKVGLILKDLESCAQGLVEVFRRLARTPRLFAGEGSAHASPLKFGVYGPRIGAEESRAYHQIMNDVASMLVLASQNAFDVMCAIEDGELAPPEALFYELGELQDRLNRLLQERATLKAIIETGLEVATNITRVVQELKHHRVLRQP